MGGERALAVVYPLPPVAARIADREAFFRVMGTAHIATVASTPDTELVIVVESDVTN